MYAKRQAAIYKSATLKNVLLLGLLYLIMSVFIMSEAEREIERSAYGMGRLQTFLFRSPGKLYEQIGRYGTEGRALYAAMEMTAGICYAVVIALLLAALMLWSSAASPGKTLALKRLLVLPLVSFLLTVFNSVGIAWMLTYYPAHYHFLPRIIFLFSKLNLLAVLLCTGMIGRNIVCWWRLSNCRFTAVSTPPPSPPPKGRGVRPHSNQN